MKRVLLALASAALLASCSSEPEPEPTPPAPTQPVVELGDRSVHFQCGGKEPATLPCPTDYVHITIDDGMGGQGFTTPLSRIDVSFVDDERNRGIIWEPGGPLVLYAIFVLQGDSGWERWDHKKTLWFPHDGSHRQIVILGTTPTVPQPRKSLEGLPFTFQDLADKGVDLS